MLKVLFTNSSGYKMVAECHGVLVDKDELVLVHLSENDDEPDESHRIPLSSLYVIYSAEEADL